MTVKAGKSGRKTSSSALPITHSLPRFGLFGGTFDPPHAGHAALARAAVRELRLDRLYVVPAGRSPGKAPGAAAPVARRLALARRTFGRLPKTVVSPWEVRRPGPSYTYMTLAALRRRHPSADWFLVMGGDSWSGFTKWRRWRDILKTTRLAVGRRAGFTGRVPAPAVRAASVVLKASLPRISSTEIRDGRKK